jgi:predicted enzyme related to lactoylglutathione lyase
MSIDPKPSVVVFVADVQKVGRFYREVAAMETIVDDDGLIVLEGAGFQLVIHALPGEPQVLADDNGHVPVRSDSYVKVCLPVKSIAATRAVAGANGGSIKGSEHEFEARGFRACDGHDPEGNVIQVRERA